MRDGEDTMRIINEQLQDFQNSVEDRLETVYAGIRNHLTKREFEVLCRRYGMDGYPASDAASIGKYYNVPEESITNIEAKALRKLKHQEVLPLVFNSLAGLYEYVGHFKKLLQKTH